MLFMKRLSCLMLAILLAGCAGNTNTKSTDPSDQKLAIAEEVVQDKMLLGLQDRQALKEAPFSNWYETNYEEYQPDKALVDKIKPLTDDLEITIFMGTWCGDSKRQVPGFYKLLDALDFPEDKVTLITMDRSKTTPDNLEEGLEITNVPTLIFKKNGKEINRIVEYPIETLEEDMFQILSGKEYKHAYAW